MHRRKESDGGFEKIIGLIKLKGAKPKEIAISISIYIIPSFNFLEKRLLNRIREKREKEEFERELKENAKNMGFPEYSNSESEMEAEKQTKSSKISQNMFGGKLSKKKKSKARKPGGKTSDLNPWQKSQEDDSLKTYTSFIL